MGLSGTRLVIDHPDYQSQNTKKVLAIARSEGILIYATNTCLRKILQYMHVKKLLRRSITHW